MFSYAAKKSSSRDRAQVWWGNPHLLHRSPPRSIIRQCRCFGFLSECLRRSVSPGRCCSSQMVNGHFANCSGSSRTGCCNWRFHIAVPSGRWALLMQPGQFTIRRALASTALIAVGCFGLSMWIPGRFAGLESGAIKLVAASCAWTAFIWIGVGVGLPFNRWRAGAGIGFVVQEVLVFLKFF